MPSYLFKKNVVLEILTTNRKEHRVIFEEALEGYKVFAIKEFTKRIEAVRKGKLVGYVSLVQPSDHTKEYDRIIKLLSLSVGDEIALDEHQFAHYIEDDWDWKRQSLASNSTYSSTATKALSSYDED